MTDVFTDGRLVLVGALTVRDAPAICARLRETIGQHKTVSIDCSSAREIDLSFIQLLVAARTGASSTGRSVTLAGPPGGALLHTLTRGGFRVVQEDAPGAAAFWFTGASA